MCVNDKYMEQIEKLNYVYDCLNEMFFENALSKAVITMQYDCKDKTYGWFTTWEAWQTEKEKAYEINVTSNHLDRNPEEVVGTLLHEMVHLYNHQKGIQDCSRGNTYHNKKYKEAAEAHGLSVELTEKYGWTKTQLTEQSKEILKPQIDSLIKLKRVQPIKESKAKKTNQKKYVCPECGTSVRATKTVRILCADCQKLMICEEDED